MAFQARQSAHHQHQHQSHFRSRADDGDGDGDGDDNDLSRSTGSSFDGAVLLFAPPPRLATQVAASDDEADNDEDEVDSSVCGSSAGGASTRHGAIATRSTSTPTDWDHVLRPAFLQSRVNSGTSAVTSATIDSGASDTSSVPASASALGHSLFPSHDGNGIFMTDSLVLSEAPSIYASAAVSDSSFPSSSSSASSSDARSSRQEQYASSSARRAARKRSHPPEEEEADSEEGEGNTDASLYLDSVGGSWALTEAALSTIPDAEHTIRMRRPQAGRLGGHKSSSSTGLRAGGSRTSSRSKTSSSRARNHQIANQNVKPIAAPAPAAATDPIAVEDDLAHMPTPTQSRASTPLNYTSRSFPTSRRRSTGKHGFAKFSQHMRYEIDGGDGQFNFTIDDLEMEDEVASGDETETEARRPSYREYRPNTLKRGEVSSLFLDDESLPDQDDLDGLFMPYRSLSFSALPRFFGFGGPDSPAHLRRSLSFTSNSTDRANPGGAAVASPSLVDSGLAGEEDSAWGGKLGGIDAAFSHWRRLLFRIRGY